MNPRPPDPSYPKYMGKLDPDHITLDTRTQSCTIEYMRILLDSDALIKLTRAGIKELLVTTFSVCVPPAVVAETTSMMTRYADAVTIRQNIDSGRLKPVPVPKEPCPKLVLFKGGDRDVAHCALAGGFAAVVTDDAYLLEKLKALGVSVTVPAAMVLAAGRKNRLPVEEVFSYLASLQPYISEDEYTTYRLILEGRYPGK